MVDKNQKRGLNNDDHLGRSKFSQTSPEVRAVVEIRGCELCHGKTCNIGTHQLAQKSTEMVTA